MHRASFLLILAASTGIALGQPSGHAPDVRFGQKSLAISGLTPGGRAIVFGVGLQPSGAYSRTFRWSGVVDDTDHDGSVTVDIGRDIPGPTIWCVADATTAAFVVVTPGGRAVPFVSLRPDAFHRRGQSVTQFAFDHSFLDL